MQNIGTIIPEEGLVFCFSGSCLNILDTLGFTTTRQSCCIESTNSYLLSEEQECLSCLIGKVYIKVIIHSILFCSSGTRASDLLC